MAKGRLKSKIKVLCLKNEKQLNKAKMFREKKTSKQVIFWRELIKSWSEYCDFLYLVCVVGPEKQRAVSVSLGLRHERALPHILFNNLCKIIFIKTLLIFLLVNYLQHEQRGFQLMDLLLSYLCIKREEQQVLQFFYAWVKVCVFLWFHLNPAPRPRPDSSLHIKS